MIVNNKRCPFCGDSPVETLMVIGTEAHNECFSCFRTWVSAETAETINTDALTHFGKTGELNL